MFENVALAKRVEPASWARTILRGWVALVVVAMLAASCSPRGSSGTTASSPPPSSGQLQQSTGGRETPVPVESNPAGDIPDSQAFVKYVSTVGGYEIEAPEGWSRSIQVANVDFRDKYNGEAVSLIPATSGKQVASLVAQIEKSAAAVRDIQSSTVKLPAGVATLIQYTSNSAADEVTGKKIRLQNEAFAFSAHPHGHHPNSSALLKLWAPAGSDNTDQWNRIARSFRWL
ncbi:MAG: hypothetical protein M3007_05760 [Candidatus Eremiobacteraeota bacterium]|nr:hypothetical protein [Candidatus Eremiobacteraeota bacterium]